MALSGVTWILLLALAVLLALIAYYAWQYYEAPSGCASYSWSADTVYDMLYSDGCVPSGWEDFFSTSSTQSTMKTISDSLEKLTQNSNASENYHLDPDLGDIFNALHTTSLSDLKVVILGQDPAPEPGEATGYAFDIPNSSEDVPTMGRIMMELYREGYCTTIEEGDTVPWADQGVLLLNSALTVQCDKPGPDCTMDTPGSNETIWEPFTQALISYISANADPSVFILWGTAAQVFQKYIDATKHKVLTGGHPSPASSWHEFFCHAYFYDANAFLVSAKRGPVDWNLCDCEGTKDSNTMVCSACAEDCKISGSDEVDGLYYSEVLDWCDHSRDTQERWNPNASRASAGLHDLEVLKPRSRPTAYGVVTDDRLPGYQPQSKG